MKSLIFGSVCLVLFVVTSYVWYQGRDRLTLYEKPGRIMVVSTHGKIGTEYHYQVLLDAPQVEAETSFQVLGVGYTRRLSNARIWKRRMTDGTIVQKYSRTVLVSAALSMWWSLLLPLWFAFTVVLQVRRVRRGGVHCKKCDYNLAGNK